MPLATSYPPSLLAGAAAALAAAGAANLGMVIQALDARDVHESHSMRLSLLGRLLRRPRWLAGAAIGYLSFPLQVAALIEAPIVLVQPLHSAGLLVPLAMGALLLGETVERRHLAAVATMAAGVALITWGAPTTRDTEAGAALIAATAVLGAVALTPYVLPRERCTPAALIVCSGLGFAAANLSAKGFSDRLSTGDVAHAIPWLAAAALAGAAATLLQMSAFQRHPVIDVVPVSYAVPAFLPVLIAPLVFDERWSSAVGAGLPFAVGAGLLAATTVLLARASTVLRLAGARA
ncbi:MAG TPA: DMT family transporter [Solirubrobacteraceae bacterium]|nr:DMT family transporter [Solirubrobacteraceae bacterium]